MTRSQLITIFLDNYEELSIHAVKLTGKIADAEDLLSDLLVKIYTDPMFLSVDKPLPYFKTCMRNSWRNYRQKNARIQYFDSELIDTLGYTLEEFDTKFNARETQNTLNIVFEKYSPELIDAFVKYHLEGYSIKELAVHLGMKRNTLARQFSRMRQKLRASIPSLWNMVMLIFLSRGGI